MLLKSVKYLLPLLVSLSVAQQQPPTTPVAQPRLASFLEQCYRNREIFERDNRLPMTTNMLIELIRRVEDFQGFNLNMQQFATTLIHRFKQDGIIPASSGVNINQPDVIQFSPRGFNFHKHRVLLTRLIPGNANLFPELALTPEEQCTLHFMLSTSIETQVRGDEGSICNQLAQYRSIRLPRDTENDDMLKTPEMANVRKRLHQKFGRYQQEETEDQGEATGGAEEPNTANEEPTDDEEVVGMENQNSDTIDTANNAVSQCPVENGVLQSSWGAIAGGTVIQGLAAGLERQTVNVRELMDESHLASYHFAQQQNQLAVDSRFAATLTGDIAEAVLQQANLEPVRVGASGAFNSTIVPRWYFLQQNSRLDMTDAEIRAGIDGLVMAMRINNWRTRAQNLRLSQVLDMYYSQRGIFGNTNDETSFRACNRRNLFPTVAPIETLRHQAFAFTTVLDGEMQTVVTLNPNSTRRLSGSASEALQTYIASNLNDMPCSASGIVPNSNTVWRAATDIFIFIDTTWPFTEIHPVIGHFLNNLDVGRFGSTYTILNADDGAVIVNTTDRLANLYTSWTPRTHSNQPRGGLNLPNVLRELRNHSTNLLNHERSTVQTGGRSHVALIVPQTDTPNEDNTNFAIQQLQIFREEVPDLRFIFWSGGSPNRFERFVREPARDIFPLNTASQNIVESATAVIHRVQQEPRRIINHRCGADWQSEGQPGTTTSTQFIEPNGIAFFRLHPNYFFHSDDNRRVRIQGGGNAAITVCHSRTVERPRANATGIERPQGEVECTRITTETVDIDLRGACDGHGVIHNCPPLFISVEGSLPTDSSSMSCTDRECRFPDSARFQIHTDNLGCFSSVGAVFASLLLVLASFLVTISI